MYSVLYLLLLATVTSYLIFGVKVSRRNEGAQKTQQSAMVVINQLDSELANSRRGSVVVGAAPTHIIFPSFEDASDDWAVDKFGKPFWQKWVAIVFHSPEKRLVRKVEYLSTPTTALGAAPPLASFTGVEKTIAQNVEVFEVQLLEGGWVVEVALRTIEKRGSGGSEDSEFPLTSRTRVRNGW